MCVKYWKNEDKAYAVDRLVETDPSGWLLKLKDGRTLWFHKRAAKLDTEKMIVTMPRWLADICHF